MLCPIQICSSSYVLETTEQTESKAINTVKYCRPSMYRLYTNLPSCVLWMLDKIEEKTLFLYFTL
jgi:chemotaxis regulatin CheY-phosphate phosphatase CheZ